MVKKYFRTTVTMDLLIPAQDIGAVFGYCECNVPLPPEYITSSLEVEKTAKVHDPEQYVSTLGRMEKKHKEEEDKQKLPE